MKTHSSLTALACLMICSFTANAADPTAHSAHAAPPKLGLGTTVAFDSSHRLWRVGVSNGHVVVLNSMDRGKTFGEPVQVNKNPGRIAADGENRPKIAIATSGTIYVTYTVHLDAPHTGHVQLAVSKDGGRTFTYPVIVNDNRDAISHRFDTVAVDQHGKAHMVWIDKRDQAAAPGKYAGAALYYATADEGANISVNKKLVDHSCECCRIAMAFDSDGTPLVSWRHIFDKNSRDHAFMRLDEKADIARVSRDEWRIDACPHHGPTLAAGDGFYHVAWFTASEKRQGLFYARSSEGRTFGEPVPIGNSGRRASHPSLVALKRNLYLAWQEYDGTRHAAWIMHSSDAGASWSKPRSVATSTGGADYPQLVNDGDVVFLSWNSLDQGYRLIPLVE